MSSQLSRSRRPVIRQWHWYTISILLFISTPVFVAAHWPCIAPSPENLTQTFSDGFACIWILNFTFLQSLVRLNHCFAFIRPVPIGIAWNSLLPIYIYIYIPSPLPPPPSLTSSLRQESITLSLSIHTQNLHIYLLKWVWIRIGLSTIASPVTVKRLAAPTALKSAAWATSKRRLVPHQKLPLPPVPDNPPSGHLQLAQANPASIYNRQSTLASIAQTIHFPRPTPVDPSLSTEPLTFPPPSRLRPLQFLPLFLPPPSKPWRLLRHNPLSLRCRARRRRLLETVVSRRKQRLSSGTTPIHLIFYGFGRDGWILHNRLGWVSVSVSQIRMAGWKKEKKKTSHQRATNISFLTRGAHFLSGIRIEGVHLYPISSTPTHSSPAVPYIFTSSGGHHHPPDSHFNA